MKIRLTLRSKLIGFCLFIGIVPLLAMGVYSVNQASESLAQQAFGQIESVRDSRRQALAQLADRWMAEARIYASVKEVYNAIAMLRDSFTGKVKPGQRADVKDPEFVDLLDFVGPAFTPFVKVLGYEDALLVDDYGRVLFTTSRGLELGEDLKDGPLKNSPLGRAWEKALKGKTAVFEDFAPFSPLGGAPTAFVASPVFNHVGGVDGVALLRISTKDLAPVMHPGERGGETGESFLVGPDKLMRSDCAAYPETHSVAASFANPGKGRMDFAAVSQALAGGTGSLITDDVAGKSVLAAYTPVKAGDVTWALVTVVDEAEAFAAVTRLTRASLFLGLGTAIVVLACTLAFLRREIQKPFDGLRAFLERIAAGDFQARLEGRYQAELATLAQGLTSMVAELKNRLGFSQGILDAMTVPCLVTDTSGRVSFVNDPLLELMQLGGIRQDYVGLDLPAFFSCCPELAAAPARCFENRQAVQDAQCHGTGSRCKSFFVRQDCAPLYDLDGAPLGVFTLFTELTEIRRQQDMIHAQHEKITHVAEQANLIALHVAQGAEELSGQMDSIHVGARHQTARLGETSAALDEVNASLGEVAHGASDAASSSDTARQQAKQGSSIVADTTRSIESVFRLSQEQQTSMHQLGKQAGSIGDIIGVIDDIADQTNLLALNAAIEAARAGDAGRGFAVVAQEVRKLAEKTMQATRQVSESISSIQSLTKLNIDGSERSFTAIRQATELVQRSGEALESIVSLTTETADRVRGIAAAAEEQSSAHELVNAAVAEVSAIAQETDDAMVHTAEAVTYLASQAAELRALIDSMLCQDDNRAPGCVELPRLDESAVLPDVRRRSASKRLALADKATRASAPLPRLPM